MWIADLSFGWPTITGSVLRQLGAGGVIGYAGCNDTRKNVSQARFDDWLTNNLIVALVIENGSEDLKGGANVGAAQGKALYAAAKSLGYDTSNCVLFASADWDSRGADLTEIDQAMAAFGNYVGTPALYGNSYAIDTTCKAGHSKYGWQSESTSFSYGLSPYARLQQLYNDPRAQGRALDVNDVVKQPLLFMGESVTQQSDWVPVNTNGDHGWDTILTPTDTNVPGSAATRLVNVERIGREIQADLAKIKAKLGIS